MKSSRTIITIPEREKRWLVTYSNLHGVSMAEAIRKGILYLKKAESQESYKKLVQSTSGIWQHGDALDYQQKIRSEWEKTPC
jgi:hypothetical protein